MKRLLSYLVVLGTGFSVALLCQTPVAGRAASAEAVADPLLAHNVYFSLKDSSDEAKKKLVDACKKHLSNHPGTVFFAAGALVEELNRSVNDRDFDVGLHIIFKNKGAHDKYQEAPRHLQFIDENQTSWTKVRVLDSYVEQVPGQ